jgi:YD repeat-containing protein
VYEWPAQCALRRGQRIASYTHYRPTPGSTTTATAAPSLDQQFAYDRLDRVTQVSTASRRWDFTYDANGNRTSVAVDGSAPSPVTVEATSNRITALTNPPITLTYDAAGNTLSDGHYTLGHDLRGRLTTLQAPGTSYTFTYNNAGQRGGLRVRPERPAAGRIRRQRGAAA